MVVVEVKLTFQVKSNFCIDNSGFLSSTSDYQPKKAAPPTHSHNGRLEAPQGWLPRLDRHHLDRHGPLSVSPWPPSPPFLPPHSRVTKANRLPQTAHKFYSTVFNWTWKNPEVLDTPSSPEENKPVIVDFNPDVNISGGISLVQSLPAPKFSPRPGRGGVVISWLVDDVEATAKVIEEAGGKMMSEARDEGGHGVYRYFEDVDGNLGSIYQLKLK